MNCSAHRYGTATQAAARGRGAVCANALMANGSWSIRSSFVVPTFDHKHEPRRLTVIPT